jgi:hypothetical protein
LLETPTPVGLSVAINGNTVKRRNQKSEIKNQNFDVPGCEPQAKKL